MLATHNPKTLNAATKQTAIRADIKTNVPAHLISSKTITIRKKYWAAPTSAAFIKVERERAEQANSNLAQGIAISDEIPEIIDYRLKQVILPFTDEYYSLTPVSNMGVLHEIFKRSSEIKGAYLKSHIIQQNPMAYANHGELMLAQAGRVRCFHTAHADYIKNPPEYDALYYDNIKKNHPDWLVFEAMVQGMNVSSGMVAVGLPTITAIGGWVHFLERETKQQIKFALGFKQIVIDESKQKYVDQSRYNKPNLTKGVAANTRFVTDETQANVRIVVIFECENKSLLKSWIKNNEFRIAGGTVWEKSFADKYIPVCDWLYETNPINSAMLNEYNEIISRNSEDDILSIAIKLNSMQEKPEHFVLGRFTVNSNGYALLQNAEHKPKVRDIKFKHAFAEPVFIIVQLHPVFEPSLLFWQRKIVDDKLIYWSNS